MTSFLQRNFSLKIFYPLLSQQNKQPPPFAIFSDEIHNSGTVAGGAPPCRSFKTPPNSKIISVLNILFPLELKSDSQFSNQFTNVIDLTFKFRKKKNDEEEEHSQILPPSLCSMRLSFVCLWIRVRFLLAVRSRSGPIYFCSSRIWLGFSFFFLLLLWFGSVLARKRCDFGVGQIRVGFVSLWISGEFVVVEIKTENDGWFLRWNRFGLMYEFGNYLRDWISFICVFHFCCNFAVWFES